MLPPKEKESSGNATHNNDGSAEPELDLWFHKFHRENLICMDERLKDLWLSVCSRHFQYQTQTQKQS